MVMPEYILKRLKIERCGVSNAKIQPDIYINTKTDYDENNLGLRIKNEN